MAWNPGLTERSGFGIGPQNFSKLLTWAPGGVVWASNIKSKWFSRVVSIGMAHRIWVDAAMWCQHVRARWCGAPWNLVEITQIKTLITLPWSGRAGFLAAESWASHWEMVWRLDPEFLEITY